MSLAWSSVKALSIPVGGVSRDVKRVVAGGVTLWEKPSPVPYDAIVQYVESDGAQYVDTGVAPGNNALSYVLSLRNQAPSTTLRGAFGCRAEFTAYVSTSYAVFLRSSTVGELRADIANNGSAAYMSLPVDEDGTVSWDAATRRLTVTVSGDTNAYTADSKGTCNETFFLFNLNTAGSAAATGATMRLYSARLWLGGALVRDLIPVRVGSGSSAVGYLYDRANPTGGPLGNGLYGSATVTPLVAGPDKTP